MIPRGPGPGRRIGRLFVTDAGRPRAVWRAGLFVLLVFGALLLLYPPLRWLAPREPSLSEAAWLGLAGLLPAAMFANWFAARRVEGLGLAALGLPVSRGGAARFLRGCGVGVLLMGTVLAVLVAAGWLRWAPAAGAAAVVAARAAELTALLALAALAEELLFRGYPFQVIAGAAGGPAAIAVTSVAFGLVHGTNPGVTTLALANITLAGILLGVAYWRTYSLWYATGVHLGWNWVMAVPADLSVSGLGFDVPGIEPVLGGPALWTGAGFGPEGGLVATLVTAAGIAGLWAAGPRRSLEVRALAPLPDEALPGAGRAAKERGWAGASASSTPDKYHQNNGRNQRNAK